MKTKYLVIYIVLYFLIISSIILTDKIFAQRINSAADIQYPVAELGSCENETNCRAYCDKPKNTEDCLDFAQKNNLMSDEEISRAKKFLAASGDTPGGCRDKEECDTYCSDINHIDECISFAEENNLIPPEELEEAKKVQSAIRRGVKPPPCGNKQQCDIYCDEPEHMEECITFGLEAGFIQGKEAEDVQKMLAAVKRGVRPPPCKGREACDEYCSSPDNMEVCMNFAIEAGFMPEEEKADAQKMLQAIKKGIKPPSCRGKNECDVYCNQEEHFEECFQFAEAAGFMSAEDAVMARKTGGKGPGGCKGKNECENFCNNPDNQETCFNFAKDNGMIPEEDLKRMEEGRRNQNFQPGPGVVNPGNQIMPEQAGPGGCKGPDECQKYCESNPEACKNFGPAGKNNQQGPGPGQMPPCEGENCKYGPGNQGPGPNQEGFRPEGQLQQIPQQFQGQPIEQQPMAPQNQQQPPVGENPPPPPPGAFLNPETFLGSVLYVIAKALYSVR